MLRGIGVVFLTASLGACGVTERPTTDLGGSDFDVPLPDVVTADRGDAGDVPADAACPSSWARCMDQRCYDIMSDPAHCGSCTAACAAGQRCNVGVCEQGDAGAPVDAPAVTDTGAPVDAPVVTDTGAPVDVPVVTDTGAPVDVPVVTDTGAREDVPPTCPGSQVTCSGMCRSLATDVDNCGSCNNRCAAGQACMSGACQTMPTTDAGVLICTGAQVLCSGYCADTSSDPFNCGGCGVRCATGQVCTARVCTSGGTVSDAGSCTGGQVQCSGYCADTSSDPYNCGGCGVRCATGQVCTARVCTSGGGGMDSGTGGGDGGVLPQDSGPCATGTISCGGYCANTSNDPYNCGGCGIRCATGQVCTARVCTSGGGGGDGGMGGGDGGMIPQDSGPCTAGQVMCSGYCATTSTDPYNCGACGVRCSGTQVCNGGVCGTGSSGGDGGAGTGDGGGSGGGGDASVTCGNPTRPCCATSPACITGAVCTAGICVANCGMPGQACCAGALQCQPGSTCTSGVCR